MQVNPYQPPAPSHDGDFERGPRQLLPLRGRQTRASIAIAVSAVASLAFAAATLQMGEASLGASARLLLLSGLIFLGAWLLAVVFYCQWLHAAASNVRALGRPMTFSPGWCVGWFFVPIANLVKPYRVVSELWLASDPEYGEDTGWRATANSSMVPIWWGSFVASNVLQQIGVRSQAFSTGPVMSLLSSAVAVVAAWTCISVMRSITARQEESFAKSTTKPPRRKKRRARTGSTRDRARTDDARD